MVIDGRKIAQDILGKLKKEVLQFKKQGKILKLVCLLVGEDPASLSFIKRKEKSCFEVGINFKLFRFSENISESALIEKVREIQNDKKLSGLIVQLPLPQKFNQAKILETIEPKFDVDCLTPCNLGKLTAGTLQIYPPTAAAIFHLLKIYNIKLSGKHIVIVGRGDLVGKPLAILLTQGKNTVTSCNKYTKKLANFTRQADILISCAGKLNLIRGEMVKKGAVILDAGASFYRGKICGDVAFSEVRKKAKLISPVPGGVGPVMVAKLLENVVIYRKNQSA